MDCKKLLLASMLLLFATSTFAYEWTATVDVNGGFDSQSAASADETENTVQCVPDDGNFTVTIADANARTGLFVTFNGTKNGTLGFADLNSGYILGTVTADRNIHVNSGRSAMLSIAAPTTEGLTYMCIEDANGYLKFAASNPRKYCEWVGVKPDSTYTKYTITNSDGNGFCKTTSFSAVNGKIEDTAGNGRIETKGTGTFNLSSDLDFDGTITWANKNKVTVTTTTLVAQPVKLTFLKPEIRSGRFQVRKNDSGCSICDNITSNNGQISFTTQTFSTYEVVELAADGDVESIAGGGVFNVAVIPSIDDIVAAVGGTNNLAVIVIIAIIAIVLVVGAKKK